MPTPKDAPYKQAQQRAKKSKKRAFVLWTSSKVTRGPIGDLVKHRVDGTYKKDEHGPLS